MNLLFLILACFLGQNLFAPITQASQFSEIKLKENSSISASQPLAGITGKITMESGATISGNEVTFSGGSIGEESQNGIEVNGNFTIYTSGAPLEEVKVQDNDVDFLDGSNINLYAEATLTRTWNFFGKTNINGHGHVLRLSDVNARFVLKQNACVFLSNITLQGVENTKFIIDDEPAEIKLTDAIFILSDDLGFDKGTFTVKGESGFVLEDKSIILSQTAAFQTGESNIWIDTRGSDEEPVFGYVDALGEFTSFIDNAFIRQQTDQSQVLDIGMAALIAGNSAANVSIESNTVLEPADQIVISGEDTDVEAGGTSITFSGTEEPQIVVEDGYTATFGNIELLRITQNTFDLSNNSALRFRDNAVLEFVEDVVYDKGLFEVVGTDSRVLLRGLGGRKRITFTTGSDGFSGGFSIGTNTLVLEDIELVGMHHITKRKKSFNGIPKDGKIVLAGQSRINLHFDSDMNFDIRGDNNKISLQANNLTLNGKIRFEDYYDSVLRIGFNITEDAEENILNLAKNSLLVGSLESESGVQFDNDEVTINNESPYSFVISKRSFLEGQTIKIVNNPILQEAEKFSFGPDVNLVTDLPNPVEIIPLPTDDRSRFYSFYDSPFKSQVLRLLDIPKARLVVKNSLSGQNLRGAISVKPFGSIVDFQPHSQEYLSLILEGNATIKTQSRRIGRIATTVKDITTASDDTANLDTLKNGDSIYVTGTNNVIVVTGFLEVKGSIFLDEGAELIFRFDDSIDSEKAIRFTKDQENFGIDLPKTSSLIFEGAGSVLFKNESQINFQGDAPEDLTAIANGILQDNRPNLIFRNYSQLGIDGGNTLAMAGKGKLLFQNNGEVRIEQGHLILGQAEDDLIDFVADKQGGVRVGTIGSTTYDSVASRVAKISLAQGTFNLRFDRGSELAVRNGGLFEIGTLNGELQNGIFSSFKFDRDAKLNLAYDGMLGVSQEDISESDNNNAKTSWDNNAGLVEGDGIIALFTTSTTPVLQAQLQAKSFSSVDISPFEVVKGLSRITDDLIIASDYIDKTDSNYKLITPNNRIVTLEPDDEVRREGPTTGNVYGTSSGGRDFAVSPDGTKLFF